jgi:TRAP-type C4-dicarboxylate transport system substrate-binding protein
MKTFLRSVLPSLLCVATVATVAACASTNKSSAPVAAKPVQLHMATITKGAGPGDTFASEVSRLSSHAVTVVIDSGQHRDKGRAGDAAILDDVVAGTEDLGVVTVEALEAKGVTALDALAAPGVITSVEAAAAVASGPVASTMLADVSAHSGVVGLGIVPGRIHYLVGSATAVRSGADLKGQPVTLFGASKIGKESFEALGATVQLDDRTNTVTYIGRAGDASPNDISTRAMTSVANVIMGNVPLWPENFVIVMNKKAYDALSTATRDLLGKAGLSQADPRATVVEGEESGALDTLCKNKMVTTEEMAPDALKALREQMLTVTDRLRSDVTVGPITKAVESQVAAFAAPKALACPSPGAPEFAPTPLTGTASALVGTWTLDVTQEMWNKAQHAPGEDGEVGRHTLIFRADGSAEHISPDKNDLPITLQVRDSVLTMKIGGTCTDCGSGETWQFDWSVLGDQLALSRHPGPGVAEVDGPSAWIIAPFTKSK